MEQFQIGDYVCLRSKPWIALGTIKEVVESDSGVRRYGPLLRLSTPGHGVPSQLFYWIDLEVFIPSFGGPCVKDPVE